jgi:hypothetical protein
VHEWRVTQLTRLGIPWPLAQAAAGHVDWHQVAKLVRRGCPPRLALQICGEAVPMTSSLPAQRPTNDALRARVTQAGPVR